jgi:hypothetical protein
VGSVEYQHQISPVYVNVIRAKNQSLSAYLRVITQDSLSIVRRSGSLKLSKEDKMDMSKYINMDKAELLEQVSILARHNTSLLISQTRDIEKIHDLKSLIVAMLETKDINKEPLTEKDEDRDNVTI